MTISTAHNNRLLTYVQQTVRSKSRQASWERREGLKPPYTVNEYHFLPWELAIYLLAGVVDGTFDALTIRTSQA